MTAGFVVLFLGLLAAIVRAHMREKRFFDRPLVARNRVFDPALNGFRWVLLPVGALLIARVSPVLGSVVVGLLLILLAYHQFIRSAWFQMRRLRKEFDMLKRTRPDARDGELLFDLASRRHQRWGSELIEQMVVDYPSIDGFSRIVVKMERGFRGFRPG